MGQPRKRRGSGTESLRPAQVRSSRSLSQREVDALVATTPRQTGETADGRRIRAYDFRSGIRFSKEQIWTLEMMHQNLAKRLSSALSVLLRTEVQVSLSLLDQGTYSAVVAGIPRPTVAAIVHLRTLGGQVLFEVRPDLASMVIERMLGGQGMLPRQPRDFSELELALVRRIMLRVLEEVEVVWERITHLEPEIDDVVQDPHFAPVALPSDAAFFAAFEVRLEEGTGTLSLIIPYPVLEPVASRLSSRTWATRIQRVNESLSLEGRRRMHEHLARLAVPVSVQLGSVAVSLQELRELEMGDVIVLGTRSGEPVKVLVGNQVKFLGRPGRRGQALAVEITEQVRDAELRQPELSVLEPRERLKEAANA